MTPPIFSRNLLSESIIHTMFFVYSIDHKWNDNNWTNHNEQNRAQQSSSKKEWLFFLYISYMVYLFLFIKLLY
jgi:hypothetical protein